MGRFPTTAGLPQISSAGPPAGSWPTVSAVQDVNGVIWTTDNGGAAWAAVSDVAINTVAGNIAPVGAQAAGAVGNAADAGHAHATTHLATSLGANVNLAAGTVTVLLSLNLGVGVWLVDGGCTIVSGATATKLGLLLQAGTANVAFSGQQSSEITVIASDEQFLSVGAIATVFVAGTVDLAAVSVTAASTAQARTVTEGFGNATGILAVQIG